MSQPVLLLQSFHLLFLPSSSFLCLSRRLKLEWSYARFYVHPNNLQKYAQILTPTMVLEGWWVGEGVLDMELFLWVSFC